MSVTARVSQALEEYLVENGGGMVTAFHIVADYIDADGQHSWIYATAADQRQLTTLGLIEWAKGVAQHDQRKYLEDEG